MMSSPPRLLFAGTPEFAVPSLDALLRAGYPPVVTSPHFKHEYIQALERSWTDKQFFTDYIIAQEQQAQRDYLRLLKI